MLRHKIENEDSSDILKIFPRSMEKKAELDTLAPGGVAAMQPLLTEPLQ